MSYTAPSIGSTGITIPAYQDIVDDLVAQAQNIYGSDIYLGSDSQDYQMISAFASKVYDTNLLLQAVYNARGPATAVGSALDVVVGINGIQRKSAVYSTATLTLTGTANTPINGGVAQDINGYYWSLPSVVTLDSTGSATVLATCQTAGTITANPGDISVIATPTSGWTSVTNPSAATVGSPAETDAQLRARQAVSTAQPSQSILEGLEGAIAALNGVTRYKVYDNDTASTDSNGVPAHSVDVVVEGGTSTDIAQAIFDYKGPGCGTYGATTVPVTDAYGVVTNINYDELGYVDTDVIVNAKQLTGYTSDITSAIQQAIASYENSIAVGTPIYNSALWGAALSANPTPNSPAFSITSVLAAVHLGATLTSALTSGTAYTTLSVGPLTLPIASGDSLVLTDGASTQTVTASASAAVNDTSISVTSFTANANYSTSTAVGFTPTNADIAVPFNQAARGNANYITVNAS